MADIDSSALTRQQPSIDIDRPSTARMYDYILGGSHNFAADREAAQTALDQMPDLAGVIRANRAFLGRAVRHLAELGIRQFLDLGSGIPTVGNVHEIAQQVAPSSRVVYVDIDPVAVLTSESLLSDVDGATVVQADFRDPTSIMEHPEVRATLDLSAPVAVLMVAVLHFVPDEQRPGDIVEVLRERVAPGSYLAMTHMSPPERQTPDGMREAQETYARSGNQLYARSYTEIEALFTGWNLQPPGLVALPQWHPDPAAVETPVPAEKTFPGFGGIGRKPAGPGPQPATVSNASIAR